MSDLPLEVVENIVSFKRPKEIVHEVGVELSRVISGFDNEGYLLYTRANAWK